MTALSPGEGAAGEAVVRLPSGAAGAGGGQVPGAPRVLPGQGITRSPHVLKTLFMLFKLVLAGLTLSRKVLQICTWTGG